MYCTQGKVPRYLIMATSLTMERFFENIKSDENRFEDGSFEKNNILVLLVNEIGSGLSPQYLHRGFESSQNYLIQ